MALFEFKFPDVGEGIHEGTIVSWKVKEDDNVEADQVIGEVETDKAVVEIPSPKKGKIIKLNIKAGNIIKVGETMVTLEVEGPIAPTKEEKKAMIGAAAGGVVGFLPDSEDELLRKQNKTEKKAETRISVQATPAVRKLAKDIGVDIEKVKGTGAGGRVTEDDIKKVQRTSKSSAPVAESLSTPKIVKKYDFWGYVDHMPLKGIRRATAEHMEQAHTIPAVSHMDEADVTALYELREKEKVNAQKKGIKLTYLPYIIKAVIEGLKKHPLLNAQLDKANEDIIAKKYYNIGIAVDTGEGLVVPVVKGADKKDVYTLAQEIEKYAALAREKKLDLADIRGGSFTITNIGVIGGAFFTPIINYPEAAILGVGKMQDKPVVRDGKVVVRKMLPLVVTFDHRIVDGAEVARFLNDVVALLQKPENLK